MRTAFVMAMLIAVGVARASASPHEIEIFVMSDGDLTIDGGPVLSFSKFKAQMAPLLRQKPCGPLQIRTGAGTQFEALGRVILLLQQSGCQKVGFLIEPAGN